MAEQPAYLTTAEGGVASSPPTPDAVADMAGGEDADLPVQDAKRETARFIRAQREQAGLSQTAVAKATSLKTQSAMWKIESGARGLSFHEAVELATVIGFSLDDLAARQRVDAEPTSAQWFARAAAALEQARLAHEMRGSGVSL